MPWTTREQSSPSCIGFSSHLWSDVAFDCWPTHRYIRALRRVFLITGWQACLRVFAPSRRDEDGVHILVLPRSFALLHRPSPPLWGSWIFGEFPLVLRRFGVDYALLAFRRGFWHYPGFGRRVCIFPPVSSL